MSILGLIFWGAASGIAISNDNRRLKKAAETATRSYGKGRDPGREYVLACRKYKELTQISSDLMQKYMKEQPNITKCAELAIEEMKREYTCGYRLSEYAIAIARLKMLSDGYIPTNVFSLCIDDNVLRNYNPLLRLECCHTPHDTPRLSITKGKVYPDIDQEGS